jgi:sugar phosphate isomerase/epimerase
MSAFQRREAPVKIAICNETFVDEKLAPWPWEKALDSMAAAGYDGVEVAPYTLAEHPPSIDAQRRRDLRRAAERSGMDLVGLHWLLAKTKGLYVTTPDDAVRLRTSDYLIELTRLCADLGGRLMVIGSPMQRNLLPGIPRAKAFEYAVEVFGRVLPEAGRQGVTLLIEPLSPLDTDFIRTAEDGIEMVRALGHPNFQLHLDVKAMSGSETRPIPDVIKSSIGHLRHFHANDPNLLGPGMGEVDHRPILRALKEAGYRGYLSVEVFDYSPGPEHIAKTSIAYLKRLLAGA